MNRRCRLTAPVIVAGGVLGGVAVMAVAVRAGLGCQSGLLLCGPLLLPVLGGAVLGAAVIGLPVLVREVRWAPPRDRWVVVACCVVFGGGFVAALAMLAAMLAAFSVAAVCAGMVLSSGLLMVGPDAVPAVGLCLVAVCGAWVIGQEPATALFLAPAGVFWFAAGLIRIGSPSDVAGGPPTFRW